MTRLSQGIALLLYVSSWCAAHDEASTNSRYEGLQYYQGDIKLSDDQQMTLEALSNPEDVLSSSPQLAVVRSSRTLWPEGRVPYIIDSSLGRRAKAAISAAMEEYHKKTCIRFIQRTMEKDYVRFVKGSGCFSYIGRIGGPQDISIGYGCEYKGIVIHEIFHALGRWHEQSRPDRDQFVTINTANVQPGVESNFDKVSSAFVTTQGVPYDFQSIMHYGPYFFTRNGHPTLEPMEASISLASLGQRNVFSSRDLTHLSVLYCGEASSAPPPSWSSWEEWSGCSVSCNGGTRTRTRSCEGGASCRGNNIDTQRCSTVLCSVPPSWSSWSQWSGCSVSCGGGRQSRTRQCRNGNMCVGQRMQFRDCNTQQCPLPSSWSSWGSWGECSSTCQGGTRIRQRTCWNGNSCLGASMDVDYCNSNITCGSQPPRPSEEWSEWTQCTKPCGSGVRFRVRQCAGRVCMSQRQLCNSHDCNPEPELRGLYHRGCYYVPRLSDTLSLLDGLTQDLSDNPFTRRDPIRKCALAAQQYGFSLFAVSAGYCVSGSNTISDYEYVQSTACADGRGGFSSGHFIMDVYVIINKIMFRDSLAPTVPPRDNSTMEFTTSPNKILPTIEVGGYSALYLSSSASLLLPAPLALLLVLAVTLLAVWRRDPF